MPGARLAPCVAPYVLRVCVTVWVYCLLLTYDNRVPFVWVLKCRPAARARESRERAPGGLFPRGAGAGGSSGPRVCRLRGALPSPASGRSPDPRSTIALRAETAGARRGAAGVHVRCSAAARVAGGRGGARGTPSWHAVPDGVCLTPTVVWRRGMPPVALAVPGVGAPLKL